MPTRRAPEVAELRAFCTAADTGSLGRAALRLGLTQPALSKRIRNLEALAGTALLERSPRGVEMTAAGERLYVEARKLLANAAEIDRLMAGMEATTPRVRLAVSHTIADFLLPAVLATFEAREAGQHHSLELAVENSAAARRRVAAGQAELAIVALDPHPAGDGLEERPLFDDEIVVAIPESHRWARRERIPQREFSRTPMVVRDAEANSRRIVAAVIADAGIQIAAPLAEVGNTGALKRVAIERDAPALLSELALLHAPRGLVARRVEGLRFRRQFALVSRSASSLGPEATRLAELIEEQLAKR